LLTSKAISQVLSIVIVIVIIGVAFVGYAVGHMTQEASVSYVTSTQTMTSVETLTSTLPQATVTTSFTLVQLPYTTTTTVVQTVTCTPTGTGNQTSTTETLLCYQQSTISSSKAAQLYQLEFVQESNCPYGSWLFPWAVVLNNSTMVVQPSNATLPLTYSGTHLTSNSNYSTIWFSVPDGTFNYSVLP
jgi:hypothetical protein